MGLETLAILDGHNITYRSFFAIPGLRTSDGRPSNALYGFIRVTWALRKALNPTHWCVVFDGGLPIDRLQQLETYKAQRPPMPDDLRAQIPAIRDFLSTARIPSIRLEGQEADDVIATLALRAATDGALVRVATNDKDLLAIVGGNVRVVTPVATPEELGPEQVRERMGVEPERVIDLLALTGDASDNVPGVPGIGPKTAARLLREYGSLGGLWGALESVQPERVRRALREHRDLAERNWALMKLRTDLELPFGWRDCAVCEPDREALRRFYRDWEFQSLLRELDGSAESRA